LPIESDDDSEDMEKPEEAGKDTNENTDGEI
jgi:hypothetical protein